MACSQVLKLQKSTVVQENTSNLLKTNSASRFTKVEKKSRKKRLADWHGKFYGKFMYNMSPRKDARYKQKQCYDNKCSVELACISF